MASVNPKEYLAIVTQSNGFHWVKSLPTLTAARDCVKQNLRPGDRAEIYEAFSVLTAEQPELIHPDIVWGEA